MTEGIIQKAFRRYRTYGQPNTINELEQEIIDGIKLHAFCPHLAFGNVIQLKELIGDSPE